MISTEFVPALNQSTTVLLRELGRFSYPDFNAATPAKGWTAGQIAEHILLIEIFICRLMQDQLEFAGRKADEKVDMIRDLFQNKNEKLVSPVFSIPSDFPKDPGAMQQKISAQRHYLINLFNSIEEDAICMGYTHPQMGTMTITEWVWFIIYHSERHVRQLKTINFE